MPPAGVTQYDFVQNVKSPKDGSNPKLPYKGSSRGVEIELL